MVFKKVGKKVFERRRVEPIVKKYGLLNLREGESPDFIVSASIGIELFSLRHQDKAAKEKLEMKICNEFISRYKLSPVSVFLAFPEKFNLVNNDFVKLIDALIDCVSRHNDKKYDFEFLYKDRYDVELILYKIFEAIHIEPLNSDKSICLPLNCGKKECVLNFNDIQKIIDIKGDKITTYKEKCEFVWLVVDVGNYSPATFADLQVGLLKETYTSKFDKTILLYKNKVFELNT